MQRVRHAEFELPILTEVYDVAYPWGRDDDFFVSIVEERPSPSRVVDLGCGTGRLAVALAARGHTVTGVDPARASLERARGKPGADGVEWVHGKSPVLPEAAYDAAVMTSHVAQFLLSDEEWDTTFADLHRAVVPGGGLVFDTRDPAARGWERWNPAESRREIALPDGRRCVLWAEVTDVEGLPHPTVHGAGHYEIEGLAELTSELSLRFRPLSLVTASLERLGWRVDDVYGGWGREPVGSPDGELLVVATRR